MSFLLNLSHCIKSYGQIYQTTHQMWYVWYLTLASNSKDFYVLPNSILNSRKVTKFGGNWLRNKKVTSKKQIGGGKDPPVLIGLSV